MSYHKSEVFKCKKRIPIKSLQAAICNVALFKNMKEKEFKDQIFISYCEDGVILEAINQKEWDRAVNYVQNFLQDKKIALLTYGYDKQIYEELISKGLKQYTRKMKQIGQECPYINIIHYHKLRKSCQYMDKQKYLEPLKFWQSKNKQTPNFAFLIVQPKQKFEDVKRYLLQVLFKKQVQLTISYLNLIEFLYLFFNSPVKDQIKEMYQKKIIELNLVQKKSIQIPQKVYKVNSCKSQIDSQNSSQITSQKDFKQLKNFDLLKQEPICTKFDQYLVKVTNYSDLMMNEYDVKVLKNIKNLTKLGLQFISSKQISNQLKTPRSYLRMPLPDNQNKTILDLYQELNKQLLQICKDNQSQNQGYCIIPYKKCQKQKYLTMLNKFINTNYSKNIQEVHQQLQKYVICQYDQIDFISGFSFVSNNVQHSFQNKNKKHAIQNKSQMVQCNHYKASIYDCPYMIIEYPYVSISDIDTFIFYLEQLKTYYCTYMVRFYGMAIRYGETLHETHQKVLSDKHKISKGLNKHPTKYKQLSQSKIEEYSYYLVFDYHHRSFLNLINNDFLVDNIQIGHIALQLLYLCQYLHTHQEPRCLGSLQLKELFWPMAVVLPYLGANIPNQIDQNGITFNYSEDGFEGDVKLIGKFLELLLFKDEKTELDEQDQGLSQISDQFKRLVQMMIKQNKYDRISISRAISMLQEILCV